VNHHRSLLPEVIPISMNITMLEEHCNGDMKVTIYAQIVLEKGERKG
jgi:hypothetical protein